MAVEVSSYKEFLADRHGTNHAIKIFPKLSLGALAKTYLRGIGTNHIQSWISNYQLDQDLTKYQILTKFIREGELSRKY
jgi:hypothetical protein